jgi:hypothetical protein
MRIERPSGFAPNPAPKPEPCGQPGCDPPLHRDAWALAQLDGLCTARTGAAWCAWRRQVLLAATDADAVTLGWLVDHVDGPASKMVDLALDDPLIEGLSALGWRPYLRQRELSLDLTARAARS